MLSFSAEKEEIDNYLKSHQEASKRFNELILSYIFYGQPGAAPQYFLDRNPMELASLLRKSLELFAVGHEYSHIILGHMQKSRMMMHDVESLEVNEIIFDWENEIQADMLGLKLMLSCMMKNGFDLALSYAGADLFFGFLNIIEKSVSILRTGSAKNIKYSTHPPTLRRREILRLYLNVIVDDSEDGKEAIKSALSLAELFEHILKLHWDNIAPLLYNSYEDGKKLDRRWLRFL
ncbi:hypothetical protein ACSAZK_16050 [Methanosarcina sp. Mfa9]|uniref:hypothetical protein n=1 Tax=Methanosarcina sp. Mfa9 TaxID=3439063 RepID=UPI003F836AD5